MGCDETVVTKCVQCFNYGSGTILPRYLASDNCKSLVNKIAQCKYMSPDLVSGETNISTGCIRCEDSSHVIEFNTFKNPDTLKCKAIPPGCTDITDCEQMHCTTTDGTTYTSKCLLCAKGKGSFVAGGVTTQCNGTMMTNCDYMADNKCAFPSSGYVVDYDGTATVSFSKDANCKSLQQVTTANCRICWDGYYWDSTLCKLVGKIMTLGALLPLISFLW